MRFNTSHHARGAITMFALVTLSLVASACSGPDATVPGGGSASAPVSLSRKSDTLQVDQSLKLSTVLPLASGGASAGAPVWTSSDSSVASVTQDGTVFALKSGSATVTVTSRGASDATTVIVRPSVRTVRFDADTMAIGLDQSVKLPFQAIDSDGNPVDLAAHTVEWSSSAPDVASVTDANVAGKTLGSADVRLRIDGKASMIRVRVKPAAVSAVTVTPSPLAVGVGQVTTLTAVVTDASGNQLLDRVVTWTTSDSTIAKVSSTGVVTPLKVGTATVTATCERKHADVPTTVSTLPPTTAPTASTPTASVASVSVSIASSALTVGQTSQATAVLKDSTGTVITGQTVSWTSSDTTIASVSASGLVTAVKAGSAAITAAAGGKSANVTVVVSSPTLAPSTVTVTTNASTLKIGEFTQANAVVKDANGTVLTNTTVTWGSSPTSVATTSTNGVVNAKSVGTAAISASVSGITGSANVSVIDSATVAKVASLVITLPSPSLAVGATMQASVTVYDANKQPLTGRTVTWSTTGPVATVSSTGLITGTGAGTATITATSDGISTSVPLTVVAATSVPAGPVVTLSPGQSIQSAVNNNAAGTVFVLPAGTYSQQSVIPKSGDVFYGQPGAILDGGGVTPYAIWVGTSTSIPSNVRVHGLIVRNYNTDVQYGAISAGGDKAALGSRGWVVDSCEIRDNAAGGIRLGHLMKIVGNNIHHNNQIGIVGLGDSTLIENNEIAFNNYRKAYTMGWEAGGVKFLKSRGTTLRSNYVHDNMGPGLWADTDVWDALYENNRVENNGGEGIFHEVSYRAIIRNNRVSGNGFGTFGWLYGAGIMVSTSQDVEVTGNTVIDNARGITAVMQNRGSDGYGVHTLDNVYVHDNAVTMTATAVDVDGVGSVTGLAQDIGDLSYFSTHNNRFVNNKYTLGTATKYFAWMNGQRTESEWQAYGEDVTGTFTR